MGLIEERNNWRSRFESGEKPDNSLLNDYRKNRDSNLWRVSRALEELLEYVIYLESNQK